MSRIALDTNLLLLYVFGVATGGPRGKRLDRYRREDFNLLKTVVSNYDNILSTPNVWTEVSNIWDFGVGDRWRRDVPAVMSRLISKHVEIAIPSKEVVDDPDFGRLGLADCVWLAVLDADTLLLTDDLALHAIALSRGLRTTNFTHLRNFD